MAMRRNSIETWDEPELPFPAGTGMRPSEDYALDAEGYEREVHRVINDPTKNSPSNVLMLTGLAVSNALLALVALQRESEGAAR